MLKGIIGYFNSKAKKVPGLAYVVTVFSGITAIFLDKNEWIVFVIWLLAFFFYFFSGFLDDFIFDLLFGVNDPGRKRFKKWILVVNIIFSPFKCLINLITYKKKLSETRENAAKNLNPKNYYSRGIYQSAKMFFGKSDEWDNKIKLALDLSKAARAFIIPIFLFLLLKFLSPFLGTPISIFTSTWSIIEIFVCLINVFFLYLWLRVRHMIELYKMIEKSKIRLAYFPFSGSGSGKVEMVGIGKVFIPKDELPIFTANPQYRVKAFADKIIQEGLHCVGSSPQEIAELEQRFDVHFPETYRYFLTLMGRSAGNLFDRNNVDVYISKLDRLNRLDRECVLQENSFVIIDRMEEPFQYIICDSPDDSPVFQWRKSGKKSRQVFDGVAEWIEYWYFKQMGNGPAP